MSRGRIPEDGNGERMTPKVSVVVPVYRAAKYIEKGLDSIFSQSLRELEVIAVNDASPDNSLEILQRIAKDEPRLKIVDLTQNVGTFHARLAGIEAASGEYLTFMDQDDLLLPGILQAAYDKALTTGADMVHFAVKVTDMTGNRETEKRCESTFLPAPSPIFGKAIFSAIFDGHLHSWTVWAHLYKTELGKKAIQYPVRGTCVWLEDFYFFSLLAYFAEHYEPLPVQGYQYYLNNGLSSFLPMDETSFRKHCSMFNALRSLEEFLSTRNHLEEYRDGLEKQMGLFFEELLLRWKRLLPEESRMRMFEELFQSPYPCQMFSAFRDLFARYSTSVIEWMTGDRGEKRPRVLKTERTALLSENDSASPIKTDLRITQIPPYRGNSPERWKALHGFIHANRVDAVVFESADAWAHDDLLWDIMAVRIAGAGAILHLSVPFEELLENDLHRFLMFERLARLADALLVPDESSCEWFRKCGCRCAFPADFAASMNWNEPLESPVQKKFLASLSRSDEKIRKDYIQPVDGESFVVFFRKLDKMFRKIPAPVRKKVFRTLGSAYDKLRRNET